MRNFFALATVIACLPVIGSSQDKPAAHDDAEAYAVVKPAAVYDQPEAYAVYSALFASEWPSGKGNELLVIEAETVTLNLSGKMMKDCLQAPVGKEVVYVPALLDLRNRSQKPLPLTRELNIPNKYELVSKESVSGLSQLANGWDEFNAKYPKGRSIHLSAVAFNENKTLALVYMGYVCQGLCGGGGLYHLEKKDGRWTHSRMNGVLCSWAS